MAQRPIGGARRQPRSRRAPVATAATADPWPAARSDRRSPSADGDRAARGPWLLFAAAVAWNLASLQAATLSVAYLNDSSLHEQMVRFATAELAWATCR